MNVSEIKSTFDKFESNIHEVVVGNERTIREIFVSLLCKGHLLLEGVPGVAKTLLAKTVARNFDLEFSRVQFTPDLMPADIVGTNVFNFETKEFSLVKGPIFTDVLLCDEINRTPPKTQSALLESMEEFQVTIDGEKYILPASFFVIATQNPIEHEGTYPLPEAQLDRFFMKIYMDNPKAEEMKKVLLRFSEEPNRQERLLDGINPVANREVLKSLREALYSVHVESKVSDYIVAVHSESNIHPGVRVGVSARAALHLLLASRALAAIEGRDFVTPDDVQTMSYPVLGHRMILKPDMEFEGVTVKQILLEIFQKTVVPS